MPLSFHERRADESGRCARDCLGKVGSRVRRRPADGRGRPERGGIAAAALVRSLARTSARGAGGIAALPAAIRDAASPIQHVASDRPCRGAGYAERGICEDDGRGQIVRVTAKGKALQRRMWPVYRAVLDREFGSKLGVREAETLARLLQPLLPSSTGARVADPTRTTPRNEPR